MEIKSKLEKYRLYLYFNGELDECTASKTKVIVDKLIDSQKDLKSVIFDFSKTSFMDSTGIGMLLGRYKKLKGSGVSSYISNPSLSVHKILQISGIYDIMPKI